MPEIKKVTLSNDHLPIPENESTTNNENDNYLKINSPFNPSFNRTIRSRGLERFRRAATITAKKYRSSSLNIINDNKLLKLVESLPKTEGIISLIKSTSNSYLPSKKSELSLV